jgi:CDP-diglyceride synthetase
VNPQLTSALLLAAPIVFAGLIHHGVRATDALSFLKVPLDDLLFDGDEVFGANKTLRGFIVVPFACAIATALEFGAASRIYPAPLRCAPLLLTQPADCGFAVGLACMLAELPNSFAKRRLGIRPGERSSRLRPLFGLVDLLDSAVGSACVYALLGVPAEVVGGGLLLAAPLHALVNRISHALGARNRAW